MCHAAKQSKIQVQAATTYLRIQLQSLRLRSFSQAHTDENIAGFTFRAEENQGARAKCLQASDIGDSSRS